MQAHAFVNVNEHWQPLGLILYIQKNCANFCFICQGSSREDAAVDRLEILPGANFEHASPAAGKAEG